MATVKKLKADVSSVSPSSEGFGTSAFNFFTVAILSYNSVDKYKFFVFYFPSDAAPKFFFFFGDEPLDSMWTNLAAVKAEERQIAGRRGRIQRGSAMERKNSNAQRDSSSRCH